MICEILNDQIDRIDWQKIEEREYLSCLHFSSIYENGRLYSQSIRIVLPIEEAGKQRIERVRWWRSFPLSDVTFFDETRADEFAFISSTKMGNLARTSERSPDGFMAPKAWNVLAEYYKGV